ncbi:META domain-containing protein [Actinomyces polynesiensis]|uniref:META domain-containing protein n=1 Tax=Actinomyces polynesiensis TaxID=1325934 RepID=UPI0005B7CEF8|nr:META domain-containing protein [Actinomyces polynesiensis]
MRTSHGLVALTTGLLMAFSLTGCSGGASESGAADPVGTWGSTAAGSPNLTFTEDGKVSGNDGCNSLSGTWTQDGDTVELGQMVTTLMACMDVDTWLSGAKSATVDGDTLLVEDEGGSQIGTLERASGE